MRELSLHLLDMIENSIFASSTVISVTIEVELAKDIVHVVTADNGTGFKVPPEEALNPFYSTKPCKRTGLGLSLFKAAAERAGGTLKIGRSAMGGAQVEAIMQLHNVDRAPMGDLASTISGIVATHPRLDISLNWRIGGKNGAISVSEARDEFPAGCSQLAVANWMAERIKKEFPDIDRLKLS